jgi:hypothetical protein
MKEAVIALCGVGVGLGVAAAAFIKWIGGFRR